MTKAWTQVGVTPGTSAAPPASPSPAPASTVAVRRTGGFAGQTKEATLDLDSDDPRVPQVRRLVDRIDFRSVQEGAPAPDRFVYHFECGPDRCEVHEPHLTSELRQLADLVLGQG